jgi:TonB family protein
MNKKYLLLSCLGSILLHALFLLGFNTQKISTKTNFSKNLGSRQIKAKLTIFERKVQKSTPSPKANGNKTAVKKKNVKPTKATPESIGAKGEMDSGSKELMAEFLSAVREKIAKNKFKKKVARRLKLTGKVKLNFVIKWPNIIEKIKIINSSNFAQIDESALQTIESVEDLPHIPKKLNRVEIPITLVISYE